MNARHSIPSALPEALTSLAGVAATLWLGYTALSHRVPPPAPDTELSLDRPPALESCVMDPPGYWRGSITGSTRIQADWTGETLACAGNARPRDGGVRLFFAGRPGAGADRLVLVIGFAVKAGDLVGREHAVSVTLIDEASSEFFHGPSGRCFSRVLELTPLPGPGEYRVAGELYCAGAIAAVTSERSVTLSDTAYAGRLVLAEE